MPLSLTKRAGLNRPMTTAELDGNFTSIETAVNGKLDTTTFTASQILAKLNNSGSEFRGVNSELDVKFLQGNQPSINLPSGTNKSSVVIRDSSGDFAARNITAALIGNASTATEASQAVKLKTIRTIAGKNFDGTQNVTIAASDVGALALTGGTLTGKLTTVSNGTTNGLQIPYRTAAPTTSVVNGDFWSTAAGAFLRISGGTKELAFTDSDITGTSSNVTGVVTIAHGGTGKTTQTEARVALGAAKSGANSDITSLSGLTTPLSEAQGGTGMSSSGPAGNFLVSDGTAWISKNIGIPVPPGMITAFYRTGAPSGWLVCNGAAVSRTTYADLWAAMGSPDTGDGNTTFNLPDLRGVFIRGLDSGRNFDAGRVLGSYQDDSFESHSHRLYGNDKGNNSPQLSAPGLWFDDAETVATDLDTIAATGGTETRPKNVALIYCIKT